MSEFPTAQQQKASQITTFRIVEGARVEGILTQGFEEARKDIGLNFVKVKLLPGPRTHAVTFSVVTDALLGKGYKIESLEDAVLVSW